MPLAGVVAISVRGVWVRRGVVVVAAVVYLLALWKVPDQLHDARTHRALTDPKDRHNARLLVTSVGGAVVVATGLLYTAGSYRLAHRGQVTDRFIKALERLSSDDLYVRYGGVLALEQIVQDAPDQAADAARVLGVFVRTRAPRRDATPATPGQPVAGRWWRRVPARWRVHRAPATAAPRPAAGLPDRPQEDLQAALTALARHNARRSVRETQQLILNELHLARARLFGADLTDAWLSWANLTDAVLDRADLTRARLDGANLTGARLDKAILDKVRWSGGTMWPSPEVEARMRERSEPLPGIGEVYRVVSSDMRVSVRKRHENVS